MTRPLVSVLTPTWQRHDLVLEAIENVRQQTYRPLEHVIISDGPDEALCDLIREQAYESVMRYQGTDPSRVPIRFVELGRNWSTLLPNAYAAAPMLVAMLLARGGYQTWCADDERMTPDHITTLVDALEAGNADFSYGRVRMYRVGQAPEDGYDIGQQTPVLGQVTNVLYHAELLRKGLYPIGLGMTSDWACIATWIAAGMTWAYVPRVTLTHRIDH